MFFKFLNKKLNLTKNIWKISKNILNFCAHFIYFSKKTNSLKVFVK